MCRVCVHQTAFKAALEVGRQLYTWLSLAAFAKRYACAGSPHMDVVFSPHQAIG